MCAPRQICPQSLILRFIFLEHEFVGVLLAALVCRSLFRETRLYSVAVDARLSFGGHSKPYDVCTTFARVGGTGISHPLSG